MGSLVEVDIKNSPSVILELNDKFSPKTVKSFLDKLPFTLDLYVWGDEIYTSSSPISIPEENSHSIVSLNDVAYWPTGKAICLFYGPTPIGKKNEIKPYSPVNIIGKILHPDMIILTELKNGTKVTFTKKTL